MIRAILVCLMTASPALACAVAEDFYPEDIARAQVVLLADVSGYTYERGAGTLTLDVAEVWKGEAPDRVTATWTESLAESPPEAWLRPTRVIAAVRPQPAGGGFDLVVEICGAAYLIEATEANIAAVKGALP